MDWSQVDWMAVGTAILGMLICTGGGLIAVAANQDKPATFVPLYFLSMIIFVSGLTMIIYCPTIWADLQAVSDRVNDYFGTA